MDPIEQLRVRAAEVLRSAAADRREGERALQRCTSDLRRVVLAAVEGLETLADALEGLQAELPPDVRELVRISSQASWERLEAAGIVLDGRQGEPLDLARHRVLKTVQSTQG